jgi:type IV pilus assembly protein PilE
MNAQARQRCAAGFSMLELVMALAIVAVLAAYSVPSYFGYVARGHRVDAIIALHRAAQFVEAHGGGTDALALTLPKGLDQVPSQGPAVYRLRLLSANELNGGYALEARPSEEGPMRADACGTFVLDASGKRSNLAAATGATAGGDCWLRH